MQHRVVIEAPQPLVEALFERQVLADHRMQPLGTPAADLVGHRAAAVGDDDLQLREVEEDARVEERQDREALFVDEVSAVGAPPVAIAGRVDMRRHVELDELFVQRVPVVVA